MPEESPVLVEVVAAVGVQASRAMARPSAQSTNAGDGIDERHELGDIVSVTAGQWHRERCAVPVDDDVVLAAGAAPVDWRWSCVSSSFEGADVRSVDGTVVHLQQPGRPQLGEHRNVQAGPDAGFGPVP